jgi:hypothetical protein
MTNILDLASKWRERRAEFKRLGALVSGDALVSDMLDDLQALEPRKLRDAKPDEAAG